MDDTRRGDYLNALTYSEQSPPFVVRDLVITSSRRSHRFSSTRSRSPGTSMRTTRETGKVRWTFKTIPTPGEFGNDMWEADSWSYSAKVTTWSMMSADPALGVLAVKVRRRDEELRVLRHFRDLTCHCLTISAAQSRIDDERGARTDDDTDVGDERHVAIGDDKGVRAHLDRGVCLDQWVGRRARRRLRCERGG